MLLLWFYWVYKEFKLHPVFLFIFSIITIFFLWIVYYSSIYNWPKFTPLLVFQNGIEICIRDINSTKGVSRKFIPYSNIISIEKDILYSLFPRIIITTTSGHHHYLCPKNQRIPAERMISIWKNHSK